MNEFNGDYSIMADHLKIMNKRMVLLNPVLLMLNCFRNLQIRMLRVKVQKKIYQKQKVTLTIFKIEVNPI